MHGMQVSIVSSWIDHIGSEDLQLGMMQGAKGAAVRLSNVGCSQPGSQVHL